MKGVHIGPGSHMRAGGVLDAYPRWGWRLLGAAGVGLSADEARPDTASGGTCGSFAAATICRRQTTGIAHEDTRLKSYGGMDIAAVYFASLKSV